MSITRRLFMIGAGAALTVAAAPKLLLPDAPTLITAAEEDPWRLQLLIGLRGTGKTYQQSKLLSEAMLKYPGSVGIYAAPTFAWAQNLLLDKMVQVTPWEAFGHGSTLGGYRLDKNELHYRNGSRIFGVSLDNIDGVRGMMANFIAIDEPEMAAKMNGRRKSPFDIVVIDALCAARLPFPDGTPARVVTGMSYEPWWSEMSGVVTRKLSARDI